MLPKAALVLESVVEGERAVKDELHRLVVVEKAVTVKWLAAASGYTESSTYKGLDRDAVNGLSFRFLDAAALGDPVVAATLLRLLSARWVPDELPAKGDDAVPQALRLIGRAADVQSEIAQAVDDGRIDATEREELCRKLVLLKHQTNRLSASLDALGGKVVDADFGRGA